MGIPYIQINFGLSDESPNQNLMMGDFELSGVTLTDSAIIPDPEGILIYSNPSINEETGELSVEFDYDNDQYLFPIISAAIDEVTGEVIVQYDNQDSNSSISLEDIYFNRYYRFRSFEYIGSRY